MTIVKYSLLIVLIVSCIYKSFGIESEIIYKTTHGKIKGQKDQSVNGKSYLTFRKVPYGKPPMNKLRLKVRLITIDKSSLKILFYQSTLTASSGLL